MRGEVLANEKNLIPFSERSETEVREIGRKGGIESGKVRRRKKTLRENMELILSLPVVDVNQLREAVKMGLDENDVDNSTLVAIALFKKSVEFGDVSAIKELRDLIGENSSESESNGQLEHLIEGLKDE